MPKKLLLAALSALAPGIAVAEDMAITKTASPTAVEIRDFRFEPPILTVTAGTTVTWRNDDDSPHTVTDKGRKFGSAALDTSENFSHTFATAGEFTYFCTLHPMMTGKIVVKPAGS